MITYTKSRRPQSNYQNIPKDSYWIGDPCYVLGEMNWGDFVECITFSDKVLDVIDVRIENDIFEVFVMPTAWGDGCYELKSHGKTVAELGVDTGMLALISKKLLELVQQKPFKIKLGYQTDLSSDELVYMDGNFKINHYSCITGDEEMNME